MMIKNSLIKNILFVQDSSPCIRTIKLATALQAQGFNIHIAHRNNTPDVVYGYGNSAFESLIRLPKYSYKDIKIIQRLITDLKIDLVHFHNEPDKLGAKLIEANFDIPVIYDQHDFMSFKKKTSAKEKKWEKVCNELADGTVYITETYKNEVARYYSLIENSVCFGNYFSADNALEPAAFLPKLSLRDNKIHLVYLGRITGHKNDHRNIIDMLRQISGDAYVIHIYPSKNKEYAQYQKIPNLVMHHKLPYRELIKEISQYDFGLTLFNDEIAAKLPHIKYAMGNKTYDYLCAGLPVLAQNSLDEVKNFTISNHFGFILEQQQDYKNLNSDEYAQLVKNIIENRKQYSMESQIFRIVEFYNKTVELFNGRI